MNASNDGMRMAASYFATLEAKSRPHYTDVRDLTTLAMRAARFGIDDLSKDEAWSLMCFAGFDVAVYHDLMQRPAT